MTTGNWFKMCVLAIACSCLTAAYGAKLEWDPSVSTNVIGYKVHCRLGATTPVVIDVGNATSHPLTNLLAGQTYSFFVTAYTASGAASFPSEYVTYTVPAAPAFVLHPIDLMVANGMPFMLTAEVSSPSPVELQWYFQGTALPGQTNSQLAIPAATADYSGVYYLVAQNAAGMTTSSNAVVTVGAPSEIATEEHHVVPAGTGFALLVEWPDVESAKFRWYRNGAPIAGATNATLEVSAATPSHTGTYTVTVTKATGRIVSQVAWIQVVEPPSIVMQPASQSLRIGSPMTLNVQASGGGSLQYQWYLNGMPIVGAISSTLQVPSVSMQDAGTYSVVISNEAASLVSELAVVAVLPPAPGIPQDFRIVF